MQKLIEGYVKSCEMAELRILQLADQKKSLKKRGRTDLIDELDLDRRIRLLYVECEQMQEIIAHLSRK